ncbi:hypothetical protein WOLCODRAFT_16272 [Wolfiporia cocos MD-104 SS10]|uniref:DUF6534 domain-containing protein n=1 Tax=Wolfiporia cocos (strain MD-104) TaxID=742152 RepID=A0A2H3JCQ9_WOLCO|nr:hypothetical protein WOLCODRAFT_16272 [Wolfiporia cocos MD-104 SS10]
MGLELSMIGADWAHRSWAFYSTGAYKELSVFKLDTLIQKCFVYALCIFEWVQTALVTVDAFKIIYGLGSEVEVVPVHYPFAWFSSITLLAVVGTSAGIIGSISLMNPQSIKSQIVYAKAIELRKMRTGYRQTNQLVHRLIAMAIETGCLTVSVALLALAFIIAEYKTDLAAIPMLIMPKLYANSVLMSFNNRTFMSREAEEHILTQTLCAVCSGGHQLTNVAEICKSQEEGGTTEEPVIGVDAFSIHSTSV